MKVAITQQLVRVLRAKRKEKEKKQQKAKSKSGIRGGGIEPRTVSYEIHSLKFE